MVSHTCSLTREAVLMRVDSEGDVIASAGDGELYTTPWPPCTHVGEDGMIIIWAPSNSPQTSTYGSDLSPEDMQYEKEHWKPRTSFRLDRSPTNPSLADIDIDAPRCKFMTLLGVQRASICLREARTIVPGCLLRAMVGSFTACQ